MGSGESGGRGGEARQKQAPDSRRKDDHECSTQTASKAVSERVFDSSFISP